MPSKLVFLTNNELIYNNSLQGKVKEINLGE